MRALDGIRIVDCTVWQQGPVATSLLGDMGAEVIKVEQIKRGDPSRGMLRVHGTDVTLPGGRGAIFENHNRSKKGIALDLKKEEGRAILYKLVENADVFVQNYRKGVADRLGLGYDKLKEINPKIVYASGSGYGLNGPDGSKPAMDPLGMARSGFMLAIGEPEMPPLYTRSGLADQLAALMLAFGIVLAIVARNKHGEGQEVDVSLFGSMIGLQGLHLTLYSLVGQEFPRHSRVHAFNPLFNYYKCKDGTWIFVSLVQSDRFWPDFCRVLEIERYEKDDRFATMEARERNCEELVSILDRRFVEKTYDEWRHMFDQHSGDFQFSRIQGIGDVLQDEQALDNNYVVEYEHPDLGRVRLPGFTISMSKTPGQISCPAPMYGQHTEETLMDVCGMSWEDIVELKGKEIIP